jgi:hypothetical protein
VTDEGDPTEEEIIAYINEGLAIGRQGVDGTLAPLLGENPDAWFGAGIFASWIHSTLLEARESLGDLDQAREALVVIAVEVRAMRDHPMALEALRRWKAEHGPPVG